MKTIFIRAPQLLGLGDQHLALQRRQVVEIHLARQMVDLVLHATWPRGPRNPAPPPRPRSFRNRTVTALGRADHAPTRRAGSGWPRHARATGREACSTSRVGQPHRLPPRVGAIDHRQPQRHPDLRRRQTIARHRIHRVDHVGPDRADLVGDRGDRRGGRAQAAGPARARTGRTVTRAGGLRVTGRRPASRRARHTVTRAFALQLFHLAGDHLALQRAAGNR